ncbi:NAD(P)/FAD-dependent oxidoreductase [Pseudomonas sp. O230]|uniref:NAD(P)/FAD-dependent oxidoreductase n=1 Tax=Pseudomonas sp. O230 TaxID=3159450 RepID=UPI00387A9B63
MKLKATAPLKRSFWMQQAEPSVQAENPLHGLKHADVAIVGGGFVGLWTALTIKQHEPDCKIVILEQDVCGGGASGRNGGFVMSWWPKIQSLLSFSSDDQALFLAHSAEKAIYELGDFCEEHDINAAYQQAGWLWTATCRAHVDAWEGTLKVCARLGATPFERLPPSEIARLTGSSSHLAGVIEKSNATVQPAALTRGMRRVALKLGVEIMEGSGVEEIIPGNLVQLKSRNGTVIAPKVVLATNAWSSAIPELAKKIATVGSSIVVTEPIPEELVEMGWSGGQSITDSQLFVDYYRTTTDGRIAFGKGTGTLSFGSKINEVFSYHAEGILLTEADFRRTYQNLKQTRLTHSWSGPIDRTYDSLPVFGNLKDAPNIHYGIGWSGNGVGPSRLGGRILASLALNRNDEWSQCSLVNRTTRTFPVEPFRFLGGQLVRSAVVRKEMAEFQGGSASILDKFLAGFAPAGLEDKS